LKVWKNSPEHKLKIKRAFGEILFVKSPNYFFPGFRQNLKRDKGSNLTDPADDYYYLGRKGKGSCGGIVNTQAWWSPTQVRVCQHALDKDLIKVVNGKNIFCARTGDPACGCGPDLLLCKPEDQDWQFSLSVDGELGERGLYAVESDKSWKDVFGGQEFVGDKHLYHTYLFLSGIFHKGEMPLAEDLQRLKNLESGKVSVVPFPKGPSPFVGYVTSPGFLSSYNNFRSRVRGLTERLLCRDIDASLNTAGLTTFLNPDLTAADRAHGELAGCSGCHFGMDNFGSAFFNWNQSAQFESWTAPKSQKFSAFGQEGDNLAGLVSALIDKSPWFHECMAKRTWENLTGGSWELLDAESQSEFTGGARKGPRALVTGILESQKLIQLRARR
jgi:hypothetical protein